MSRMNYNRPNNGYESEPWRRGTVKQHMLPMTVLEHQARKHDVVTTKCRPGSVHAAAYRCLDCNLHLGWAKK